MLFGAERTFWNTIVDPNHCELRHSLTIINIPTSYLICRPYVSIQTCFQDVVDTAKCDTNRPCASSSARRPQPNLVRGREPPNTSPTNRGLVLAGVLTYTLGDLRSVIEQHHPSLRSSILMSISTHIEERGVYDHRFILLALSRDSTMFFMRLDRRCGLGASSPGLISTSGATPANDVVSVFDGLSEIGWPLCCSRPGRDRHN